MYTVCNSKMKKNQQNMNLEHNMFKKGRKVIFKKRNLNNLSKIQLKKLVQKCCIPSHCYPLIILVLHAIETSLNDLITSTFLSNYIDSNYFDDLSVQSVIVLSKYEFPKMRFKS